MRVDIGISDKNRAGVVVILNSLLADEYVLYTKTRNYHWNVCGSDFAELHKFFEAQYEELDGMIDEVAERARSLGGRALGALSEFMDTARVKEFPGESLDAKKMLTRLLEDHEQIVTLLREDLETCMNRHKDMGTADFLTGLMEKHEKMAWMLRSFLE
ncbi:MAG: DNA starvation/stationary phase protection protein [Candidatus Omnitrophica bacterium]|nr:DNA starvation/stationary phase protection protein [Candidatus Omnitrophota bacterium]